MRMRSARAGPGETAAAPAAARSFRNERRCAFMSSSVPAKRGVCPLRPGPRPEVPHIAYTDDDASTGLEEGRDEADLGNDHPGGAGAVSAARCHRGLGPGGRGKLERQPRLAQLLLTLPAAVVEPVVPEPAGGACLS